jgi:hypothetical protein
MNADLSPKVGFRGWGAVYRVAGLGLSDPSLPVRSTLLASVCDRIDE